MPVGATLAAAAITTGGMIYSSNQQSSAIKKASQASTDATNKVREDAAPWRTAGETALGQISNPNDILSKFTKSPDYAFRQSEGMNGILTNRATNGLLKSGSTLRKALEFNSNLAGGEFGNWWDRNKGLSDTGLRATGITVDPTMTNAANQGNAAVAQGNNQSSLIGGLTDILSGVVSKYGSGGSSGGGSSYGGAGYSDLPSFA